MNKSFWKEINYFKPSEFDSPDVPGSGYLMDMNFIYLLNEARKIADVPFIINSGYRTLNHNKKIKGSPNSSHLIGVAADIKVINGEDRIKILRSLIDVGLDKRIGIAETFIHVDNDFNKNEYCWLY